MNRKKFEQLTAEAVENLPEKIQEITEG